MDVKPKKKSPPKAKLIKAVTLKNRIEAAIDNTSGIKSPRRRKMLLDMIMRMIRSHMELQPMEFHGEEGFDIVVDVDIDLSIYRKEITE